MAKTKPETSTDETTAPQTAGPIVQLTCNVGDRQSGETFTTTQAKALGIADKCVPLAKA